MGVVTASTTFLLLFFPISISSLQEKPKVHIVYFGEHSSEQAHHEIEATHTSYLASVKDTVDEARASLLYSYKNSINGFAALLTSLQASKLSQLPQVLSVFPSQEYSLQTTRSWDFSGLNVGRPHISMKPSTAGEATLLKAKFGKQIIVGLLDSGVWPESKSFRDKGMRPIPESWKGVCQTGDAFNSSHCNRKLIGARYYIKGYEAYYGPLNRTIDYLSPRDMDGHGTHTSSTVGGRRVRHASFPGGLGAGMASGGAPFAHLAIYKACWAIPDASKSDGNTCFTEDMLAAIDDAIGDGVHVLSMSIVYPNPINYTDDAIAIGSFHALKRDIVPVCSAGNNGPAPSTLSNPAPWIITVGASSIDRTFTSPVVLGNGLIIPGQAVTPYKLEKNKHYPLVYAAEVVGRNVPHTYIAGQCLPGSLSPKKAKGKIVLCLGGNGTTIGKGMEAKRAGAVGFILGNSPAYGNTITVDAHVLLATRVGSSDAIKILGYINTTEAPTANIVPAKTELHTKPAPTMASFSSRGPNVVDPYILKPDITAPGVNILAAWTGADSPSKLSSDNRVVQYNILSGTSMSCPHVAATAALVKAIHPTWSTAAIRSALMTTAGLRNNMGSLLTDSTGKPADPFQFGSGHFRPAKAADPGLVYDASYTDYRLYLCSVGVHGIDKSFKCPKTPPAPNNLNYPSLAIPKLNGTVTVRRTVTNVGGDGKSVYLSAVKPPQGYSVTVSPTALRFERVGEKRSFTITVKAGNKATIREKYGGGYGFGWYTWSDGSHVVRSPLAVSL